MRLFNSFFGILSKYKKTLVLILVVSTGTLLISSGISMWLSEFHNLSIPTIGNIKTIGVEAYWDPDCENKTESIDWSTLWPGLTNNVTLYLRSVSNIRTTLHLNITDLNPADLSEYIKLSWDYNGTTLNPDQIIRLTLSLSASADKSFSRYLIDNKVTYFNIDVHIAAYE